MRFKTDGIGLVVFMNTKIVASIFLASIGLVLPTRASDLSQFETTCADIGFNKNTEAFGDCVLELVSRNKKAEVKKAESLAAAKQLEYERQKEREIEALRQQQAIQQQQLAMQQQQAMRRQQEPSDASFLLQLLGAAASGYNEGRHPPTVHCTSSKFGNSVDTTCR
jgi:hypothetical protein